MAISNVRSSAYRAAGGKAWNKVKSGGSGIRWEGPEPEWQTQQRHRMADAIDKNYQDKAAIRKQLAEGYDESLVTVIPEGKRAKRGKKDRKSTRLNSSHVRISYAVFC